MTNLDVQYNKHCPGVKRLMREALELAEPTEDYTAKPLEDNLFEWHFTLKGAKGSDFDSGIYHGRIILPQDYPMKPPHIIMSTPNGRFEENKKICLSISGFHPETWQPSWSIRTALVALIAFMPTPVEAAIGSVEYTAVERRILARKSRNWVCPACGPIAALLSTTKTRKQMLPLRQLKKDHSEDMMEETDFNIRAVFIALIFVSVFVCLYRRWSNVLHAYSFVS